MYNLKPLTFGLKMIVVLPGGKNESEYLERFCQPVFDVIWDSIQSQQIGFFHCILAIKAWLMFISFRSSFTSLPLPALFLSFVLSLFRSLFISNLLPLSQKTWNGMSILLMLQEKKNCKRFYSIKQNSNIYCKAFSIWKGCNILWS